MDSITHGLASSTLGGGGHKIKIHQNIPSGSIKKGPHAIVRSVDLNDCIEIQRRFGEGSKPLFARDDIAVNQSAVGDKIDNSGLVGCKTKTARRSSSTASSSPERYRHRDNKKHSSPPPSRRKSHERLTRTERYSTYDRDKHSHITAKTDRYNKKEKSKSRSPTLVKKRPPEKVPYYRDEAREKDRLRRLYGTKDRGRSRSRTPRSRKYSPVLKRRLASPKRRRSSSRDKYRRRSSPYRSSRRDYRSRKSPSRSRSRSPQRRHDHESHKHYSRSRSSRERDKESKDDTTAGIPPTPQFIPIPIAVPADYAYSFTGWPATQPSWPSSHHRPPPAAHYAPYHMIPMMPPMRPPLSGGYGGLPPPMPYAPMQPGPYRSHGPQRFPTPRHSSNHYQPRSKKPSS